MSELNILQPDDFHLHLRDGEVLRDTVGHALRYHHHILVMPNTKPPIRRIKDALAYQKCIQAYIPPGKREILSYKLQIC